MVTRVVLAETSTGLTVGLAVFSFVGGLVVALVGHWLAGSRERRSDAAKEAAARRDEDRDRVLALRKKVKAFIDDVGNRFASPYTQDGLASDWDDEQRLRAKRYERSAGSLAEELDSAAAAFHDPRLGWITTVAANVADRANAALKEDRPSPAANVLGALVEDVQASADTWLRDPAASPVLSGMAWDWYDEVRDTAIYAHHADHSASALMSRVWQRYVKRIGWP
jgi:hypothetical protein